MNEIWVGGVHTVVSDWDGKMASVDCLEGVRADIPTALACLLVNLDARNYDSLGLGPGDDVIGETRSLLTRELEEDVDITNQISIREDRVRSVQNLSLAVFRRLLVNHFAILLSQNRIVWPKRIHTSHRRIAENAN